MKIPGKFFLFQGILFFIVLSLKGQAPVASFLVNNITGCSPLNVQFTNTSTNAVSYSWTFGNGNSSSQVNPTNIYNTPGTYTVQLTAYGPGGQNTHSLQVQVIAPPVSNFSVQQNVVCQGGSPVLFQNLSTGFDSVYWDFGDGTSSSQFNPSHVYQIAGTFNVTLVVFNKIYGCQNSKTLNGIVTINPKPIVNVTVNDSAVCDPAHVFTFQSNSQNAVTWNWNFGDGNTSVLPNPQHIYSDTGYKDITLITTSAQGCNDTTIKQRLVHIKSNPVPIINPIAVTGCQPFRAILSTPFQPGAEYDWDMGNGKSDSVRITYHTYVDSGSYTVTLTTTYPNGCINTNQYSPITVYESPSINYTITNYTGCVPLTVNFINNTTGNFSWLWDFGDGTTSNLYAPVHTYTTQGIYQVSLTATSINGCSQGYPLNAKVRVTSPSASFAPDINSGCPPLTVNFNDKSTDATTWIWDFGDGNTSTQQFPTHTYNNNGVYTVTLIAGNSNGCMDTFIYNSINVSNTPVNYTPPAPVVACPPHVVNFADASGASQWYWEFGDGTVSSLSNPSHTYTQPGTYVVSLTTWAANGGCEQYIPDFQTFIIDSGVPDFSYTVTDCPPYIVTFSDSSLNAAGWFWNFGDGSVSTTQNPVHIYPNPGDYDIQLTVTTPTGCRNSIHVNNGVQITGLGSNASAVCQDTVPPYNVQFYANSTQATWWLWDFGDSTTSTLEDPLHVYPDEGPYTITLTVGNDSCMVTYEFPSVGFGSGSGGGDPISGGPGTTGPPVYHCAPYTVQFNNPADSVASWLWDFGDGSTSNLSSPFHTYTDSGTYQVILYVTYINGLTDTLIQPQSYYISKPARDFTIFTTNTCTGVIVDVSANTTGNSFLWNFGNGNTDTSATATFTYPAVNGGYLISLNYTDTNGCGSFVAKSFNINSTSPLTASKRRLCAGDSVTFNPGNVNYASYSWNFGDGNISSNKIPVHTYQDSGVYIVSLTVTDIYGCQQVFNMAYSIEVFDPVAAFTYVTASNCTTVSATFTNQSQNSDKWRWSFGDGSFSSLKNPIHYYSTPGNYTVTLTAFRNVCSSTVTIPNAVYVAQPVADFSFVQTDNCLPVTINFQDLSTDAVQWNWDFGDGNTSTLQNPVHTYTVNPSGPVVLSITDVNGCVKTVSRPNINITQAVLSYTTSGKCNPVTVTFTDSSLNAISLQWDLGDGTFSSASSITHIYNTDGYYNIQLIAESAAGCFDTLRMDSLIVVSSTEASFIADTVAGCMPLIINFSDNSYNATTYQWNFGDGGSSGNSSTSHIYTQPGIYDVSLVTTDQFGCKDTLLRPQYITVKGAIPDFSISTFNGCVPLTVEFTDLSIDAFSWEWHFGDGTADYNQHPVHVYTDTGTFAVTLFAIDSAGCSSSYTFADPIRVAPVPDAVFSASGINGCTPYTVQFDDPSTVADSMIWDMGDGTFYYSHDPQHTYNLPGTYQVRLFAKNNEGCYSEYLLPDLITVNLQPVSEFTSDISSGCIPLEVNFSNQSSSLLNPQFIWNFGNGDTSGQLNPSYTYTVPGSYYISLEVMNEGGCTSVYNLPDPVLVHDQVPPPAAIINRVTVNSNTEVELNWEHSTASDISYYIISRLNPVSGIFDSTGIAYDASIPASQVPAYYDFNVNTPQEIYTYKVQAVDICGYREPLDLTSEHSTINLTASGGFRIANLTWTEYKGCNISGYEIFREDNGSGNYHSVGMTDAFTTSFTDTTAYCAMQYSYRVRALDICLDPVYVSWSDTALAFPASDIENQKVVIVRSTVMNNRNVLTEWNPPVHLSHLVTGYDIFRSFDGVNFTLIDHVPDEVHEYIDTRAKIESYYYTYKVNPVNVCNSEVQQGDFGNSILLKKMDTGIKDHIRWNPYINWDTGVDKYVIEKLSPSGTWVEVETLNGNITEWEEE